MKEFVLGWWLKINLFLYSLRRFSTVEILLSGALAGGAQETTSFTWLSCWPWARNSFASSSCQYLKYDTSDFPDIGLGFKGFFT
ncbi:hypothetical protein Peur_072392 [Populus x canadensis]